MDTQHVAKLQLLVSGRVLHCQLHRVHVRQHLKGVGPDFRPGITLRFGTGQPAGIHLEALDLRGRDRLGAKQQSRKGLQRRMRVRVQRRDRPLGLREYAHRLSRQGERIPAQQLGHERVVRAGAPMAGRRVQRGVVLPRPTDQTPTHVLPLVRDTTKTILTTRRMQGFPPAPRRLGLVGMWHPIPPDARAEVARDLCR